MAEPALHVVATAGHVDHGKSSLILRLTGIDPDRWEEEKRRGLTIDLGFAWCTLPSGREVGFVDVPGHERFVRNMLAGVGPVRLVLFVVAADEGWKPQSEEHLQIVDVLGAAGGVVALTKVDLVDAETRDLQALAVRDRLAGTALADAPIVPCSSATGEGLDRLRDELDALLARAPVPEQDGRARLFVDRVFTIRGAGTVVTGTLTGGRLSVGQEVEVWPVGARARIRSLQTHKRSIDVARPVSRVAANLVGVERARLERGDVIGPPGAWRGTRVIEVHLRPVRGLAHPLTARGAYKLYAGSAERDARLRLYDVPEVRRGEEAFARIHLSAPLVLDVHDRFVLREVGRRETVAGGVVLDVDPPERPGPDAAARLRRRLGARREELPAIAVEERGAVRAAELVALCGRADVERAERAGDWWIHPALHAEVRAALERALGAFHRERPLLEGADVALARGAVLAALRSRGAPADPDLVDALLGDLEARGVLVRAGRTVRLASHLPSLGGREEEVERVVRAVAGREPSPPTVPELVAAGTAREVIDAAVRAGLLVRISPDLVFTPGFVARATEVVRELGASGVTVSAFRERLGTSRRYALPLLEHFDRQGLTRRQGDLRFVRADAPTGR
ncbi:MAG TPA: selenocysteine-specific translation elongation factor [Actinomycetota bacterium]|nr:selenocysteine-specific translation elongation factor [Actinomycetota bacterium]